MAFISATNWAMERSGGDCELQASCSLSLGQSSNSREPPDQGGGLSITACTAGKLHDGSFSFSLTIVETVGLLFPERSSAYQARAAAARVDSGGPQNCGGELGKDTDDEPQGVKSCRGGRCIDGELAAGRAISSCTGKCNSEHRGDENGVLADASP